MKGSLEMNLKQERRIFNLERVVSYRVLVLYDTAPSLCSTAPSSTALVLCWGLRVLQGAPWTQSCLVQHHLHPCLEDVGVSSWVRWASHLCALLRPWDHIAYWSNYFSLLRAMKSNFIIFSKDNNDQIMCVHSCIKLRLYGKILRGNITLGRFLNSLPDYFSKKNVWLVMWPQKNPPTSPNPSFRICHRVKVEPQLILSWFFFC